MVQEFEVRWEGELPATRQEVWDAVTLHTASWYWEIEYEPVLGGAERGLSSGGGTVTAWDPPRHFATRAPVTGGFNQIEYRLEPRAAGTHLRFVHRGVFTEDHARQLDACRQHTAFYYHSLGEYLRHFPGRDATYVAAEAPATSATGGTAVLRRALGVPGDVAAGDRVRLTPAGLEPIEGVVDYATPAFLGVRSAGGLYRFYGRDAWGWPVGIAHHVFAATGTDEQAWTTWLDGVFATEAVA